MSNAFELLRTRRSVPAINLGEPGPDSGQLHELLTIASRVPDHGKLVPWRFIVYSGDAAARAGARLAELWLAQGNGDDEARLAQERNRLSQAPLVVGVVSRAAAHPKIPEWEQTLSAGAACMALVTASHAMGFAAQWLTGWIAYDAEATAFLGLEEGERFAGFIHIGTPTTPPVERPRPDLDEIVTTWAG